MSEIPPPLPESVHPGRSQATSVAHSALVRRWALWLASAGAIVALAHRLLQ